jgi:hypothetical protein
MTCVARWRSVTGWLNTPAATRWACAAAPILGGVLSLLRGQDANVDLLHYHLYNPYAWLTGRVGQDLAPGGMQSYFNPLLDVPFYLMERHWPAPLAGFAIGFVEGGGFLLLLGICRAALAHLPCEDRRRVPLLLAAAGCLTTNVLTSLGNSMGDNLSALFDLAAILAILRAWDGCSDGARWPSIRLGLGGLILGAGIGLKLTNVVYAPALCVALIALPPGATARPNAGAVFAAAAFAAGVALGVGATAGFWFAEMARLFGNPLFPQFGAVFPSPLARPFGVADTVWRPRTVGEALAWPVIFTLDPRRVGQIPFRQIIWPLAFGLLIVWAIAAATGAGRRRAAAPMPRRCRFVILALVLSYAGWMGLFSIFRYIVAVEMLLPLLVWIVLERLLAYPVARRAAAVSLAAASLVVLAGGTRDWGTADWAEQALRVETPSLPDPAATTIVFTGPEPPQQYLALFLPEQVAFVGLPPNFPDTPAFGDRVTELVERRGGPVYAILPAAVDGHADKQARLDRRAAAWGLTRGEPACAALGWLVAHLRTRTTLQPADDAHGNRCRLVLPAGAPPDLAARDRVTDANTSGGLAPYGFALLAETCTIHSAFVGQQYLPYQFCRLRRTPPADPT